MKSTQPNTGVSLLTVVMPWKGIMVPNAAIITDKVAQSGVFTSVEIQQLIITVYQNEELTNDLPGISEEEACKIGTDGLVSVGQQVFYNDILVGKIDKSKQEGSANEKLLKAIFGDTAGGENCSMRMPFHDPAIVVSIERNGSKITINLAIARDVRVGDILYDSAENEIVIAGIIPESEMPHIKGVTKEKPQIVITAPSPVVQTMNPYWHDGSFAVVYSLKNPGFTLLSPQKKIKPTKSAQWECLGESATIGVITLQKVERLVEQKIESFGICLSRNTFGQLTHGLKFNKNFIALLQKKGLKKNVQEILTIKSDTFDRYANALGILLFGNKPTGPEPTGMAELLITFLKALGFSFSATEHGKVIINRMTKEHVLELSSGEVLKSESINFKTGESVKNGIACQKIFGSITNYRCECGKYDSKRWKGTTCDKCGVTIDSSLRKKRFGHIAFAVPIVHPFSQKVSAFCSKVEKLWKTDDDEVFGLSFTEYIAFARKSCGIEESEIMTHLPILPAGLREITSAGDGRFYSTDINDLYERVIIRNNRLIHLIEMKAPTVIFANEARMLQESVNNLFKGVKDSHNRFKKGLSQHLAESNNLLYSKKVSYACKGVGIPAADIAIDECRIPTEHALEIFQPYIIKFLIDESFEEEDQNRLTFKSAKKMVQKRHPHVIEILDKAISDLIVLVTNSNQDKVYAFKPLISTGEAIQLHSVALLALGIELETNNRIINIHVPLLSAAQEEARSILFSSELRESKTLLSSKRFSWIKVKNLMEVISQQKEYQFSLSSLDQVLLTSQ